jgi:hypothetical protein
MPVMSFARRNIPYRRAVLVIWLLLGNMALTAVYMAVGESLAVATVESRAGAITDLFALSVAFIGWWLAAIAWRRSLRLGVTLQIALPLLAVSFLWFADRDRLPRLAAIAPSILLVTVATGCVVTLIMYFQSRRRPPSS